MTYRTDRTSSRVPPAVASVGAPASAAVSPWSLSSMQPCAHLLLLSEACAEAAAPLLDDATQRVAIMALLEQHPRTFAAVDERFAEDALRAARLKQAEQLLRQLAQDPDFHLFAEARAAGRVLLVQEADGPAPVVVAGEQHTARVAANDNWLRRGIRALSRSFRRAAA